MLGHEGWAPRGGAFDRGAMTGNRLFYYPYATLTDSQLPLIKIAALYFDKLVLLDPRDATFGTRSDQTPVLSTRCFFLSGTKS